MNFRNFRDRKIHFSIIRLFFAFLNYKTMDKYSDDSDEDYLLEMEMEDEDMLMYMMLVAAVSTRRKRHRSEPSYRI